MSALWLRDRLFDATSRCMYDDVKIRQKKVNLAKFSHEFSEKVTNAAGKKNVMNTKAM